ncbi:MAG TPA: hypothetical protein VNW52_08445 [Burkholderiaceae bacterium]|jgi:hypothetical protein|nr:hypothetical protein [Burkholderiaceae bacterium]
MTDQTRSVATVDKRPYFEKVLCYGVQHGVIDPIKVQMMITDGAKGALQVAQHFGTSHLYGDLDNARKRIVNLVSLYLENTFPDSLVKAAESLRDNSFLSHSRGGNEMLKQLHAMPELPVFQGANAQALKEFQDERTLAKPLTLTAYRKELKRRHDNIASIAVARWFAKDMGVPFSELDYVSAEMVTRTALLMRLSGHGSKCPSPLEFRKVVELLRSKGLASGKIRIAKSLLDDVPQEHRTVVDSVKREIETHDVRLLIDATVALDAVLNEFKARYFFRENGLEDVDQFDAFVSKEWLDLTKGKEDSYSRQTLFVCLAAGVKPKTSISETEAKALIKRTREHGLDGSVVSALIKASAPIEIKQDLLAWWEGEFFPEAEERLVDPDMNLADALEFLKDCCNIKAASTVGSRKKS